MADGDTVFNRVYRKEWGYILNGFDDFTKAVFAPKCSQNYKNESVLVNYALSLFYESVSKSDCIILAKT